VKELWSYINDRVILITIIVIIGRLILDSSIPRMSIYTGGIYPLNFYLAFFICIVILYGLMQYVVITFVKQKIRNSKMYTTTRFSVFFKFIPAVQYVLFALLIAIILQMIITTKYNVLLLVAAVYISYIVGFVALGILTYKYLIWSKENHNPLVIIYLLATSMICLNSIFTVLTLSLEFDIRPDYIRYARGLSGGFSPGATVYSTPLQITYILSFLFTWIATAMLLYSYYDKSNRLVYCIAMSVPILYFFSLIQPSVINLFFDHIRNGSDAGIIYTLFSYSVKPIGGILFGIAFWRMSKSIDHVQIKNYMIISAYGMMLIYVSNQPTGLIQAPFPPFGLVTAAFFGLAAFLFLIGVYSSAISVSQDRNIRKYISNYAKQLTFLGGIGSSEMETEIQKIVKNVMTEVEAKTRDVENTTGIESSLQEQDIKEYVKIAIQEAKRKQTNHK
jgi:hypothetical protein